MADEMGSESDSELRWKDSGDLSRAIAYGVLTALDRSPESFHLSSSSSSSPISSATSSPSSSALPVADEGGLPAAVRHNPILTGFLSWRGLRQQVGDCEILHRDFVKELCHDKS